MANHFKKGLIPVDLIFVLIVFITILGMFVMIGYTLTDSLRVSLDASDADMNTSALNDTLDAYKVFNSGIPFIFFGFVIISIILAVQLKTSPAISFFMFIIISVVGYIAQGMANMFYQFSRNASFTDAANELDLIVTLQDYLPVFILIAGLAIVIFMFSKPKSYDV